MCCLCGNNERCRSDRYDWKSRTEKIPSDLRPFYSLCAPLVCSIFLHLFVCFGMSCGFQWRCLMCCARRRAHSNIWSRFSTFGITYGVVSMYRRYASICRHEQHDKGSSIVTGSLSTKCKSSQVRRMKNSCVIRTNNYLALEKLHSTASNCDCVQSINVIIS